MKNHSFTSKPSDRDMTALMNELITLGSSAVPNMIASRWGIDTGRARALIQRVALRPKTA